jgi:hypothetical protein
VRVALLLVLGGAVVAVTAAAGPAPGQPGYRAPWNRPATDSLVDLDPGGTGARIELHGRLVAADDVSPMGGLVLYAYHADQRGAYGTAKYPDLHHKCGVLRTGPGGGYVIRSTLPGMYEGPPHIHMDAELPGRGRCTWWVAFRPDRDSWPLPGTMNLGPATAPPADESRATLHRDPDDVYRAKRTLHVGQWFADSSLDSLRAAIAAKYERAPWRRAER